jgi:hypothetical protein
VKVNHAYIVALLITGMTIIANAYFFSDADRLPNIVVFGIGMVIFGCWFFYNYYLGYGIRDTKVGIGWGESQITIKPHGTEKTDLLAHGFLWLIIGLGCMLIPFFGYFDK